MSPVPGGRTPCLHAYLRCGQGSMCLIPDDWLCQEAISEWLSKCWELALWHMDRKDWCCVQTYRCLLFHLLTDPMPPPKYPRKVMFVSACLWIPYDCLNSPVHSVEAGTQTGRYSLSVTNKWLPVIPKFYYWSSFCSFSTHYARHDTRVISSSWQSCDRMITPIF